jgi:hypothetical protein
MNNSYIGPNELIYNNDNGIHSGGFNINSIMMKNDLSPILTLNSNINGGSFMQQDGGSGNAITKVSDLFTNLVIPNWNLSYNYKHGGSFVERNNKYEHDDIIEDELHDKLLNLVKVHEDEIKELSSNKKKSRKNLKQPKNNTKKYRNKL